MGSAIRYAANANGTAAYPQELPASAVAFAVRPQPDRQARPPIAGTLLLVDDVAMNREILGAFLRNAGYAVVLEQSGREAIRLASETVFDLILMDVRMPDMDGLEVTRRIRNLPGPFGKVPVIALSAYTFDEQISACRLAGMDAHVAKPVDFATLVGAVENAIVRGPPCWPANRPVAAAEREPSYPRLDRAVLEKMLALLPLDEVKAHLQSLRVRKEQMVRLLDQSTDLALLADAAHALASAAGTFGFVALSKTALSFERAVARDAQDVKQLGPLLRLETCAALAALDGPLYDRRNDQAGDGHGVILVENDPLIRGIIRAVLKVARQPVFLAGDGLEAVVLATQFKVRMVLLDIGLPRLNGLLACEAIRAQPHYADVPIIMLTGYADGPMHRTAQRLGATDFIVKPFRPDELLARLAVHLDGPVPVLHGVFEDVPASVLAEEAIASDSDGDALRGGWLEDASSQTDAPHVPIRGLLHSLDNAFRYAGIAPHLVRKWFGYAQLSSATIGSDAVAIAEPDGHEHKLDFLD